MEQVRNLVVQTNDASGGWQVFLISPARATIELELRLRLQPGADAAERNVGLRLSKIELT